MSQQNLDFHNILKIQEKDVNPQKNAFCFVLLKRKFWKVEQPLKVEIEDAP